MPNLKHVKIFPPIGIARLGNSPEWFIGPELPFPAPPQPPSDGKYKDAQCRVRKQAQRFRLWGYFDDGSDRELTTTDGAIQWTVHLANAKAVFQGEAGGLIDPGTRTLNGANDTATFANGTYKNAGHTVEVPLGGALTDDHGRLVVYGGYGDSGPTTGTSPTDFWGNAGWYDDVSDGPVNATIQVGGQSFTADGAWVICPPPRFAPSTYAPITLYDTMREVAIEKGLPGTPAASATPSFVNEIWPILTRGIGILRVQASSFNPGDHSSLASVIPPGPGQDTARQMILGKLSNPTGANNVGQANQPNNMPLVYTSGGGLGANPQDVSPTLRKFQYDQMAAWSAGSFVNDWPPVAPTAITPDGLTRAALENCIGAPFYPGIEATVTVNDGSLKYVEAFRLDQSGMNAGDVTKGMARPWQADFTACRSSDSADSPGWWPSARPDFIYPDGSATAAKWTRVDFSYQDMVNNWSQLGFIVDPGTGLAVERERTAVCKDCFIITDRNEIGKEEAQALINANEQIVDAFYVVVEGYAPSDLGITTATPNPMQLQAWAPHIAFNPVPGQMFQRVNDMALENNGALTQTQRITFGYNIYFTGTNDFTLDVVPVQINATVLAVSSSATIDLTKTDAPYMDHGPISWLSNDTRVFKLQPGQTVVGAPPLGSDPLGFIQGVLTTLRTLNNTQPTQAYNAFEGLPAGETGAAELEWLPTIGGQPVYNFALCRVRYRATVTQATGVRLFFRLFQTASTGTEYNSSTTYKVGGQGGVKIPLLGIQGGELVTIPFFASGRVPTTADLNSQTDDFNKQDINPGSGGHEAYMYYGCWLDINQNQPQDKRYPIQPSPANGPFLSGTLYSIADLIRGTHQCMVTEINVDWDTITPQGISTAACDRLSQRNLAIDHSDNPGSADTHRVQHTFAIHPTIQRPLPGQGPDELMISWGNTPVGTTATVYLPGVQASDILNLAARKFNLQTLEKVDDHTVRCHTAGVTYLPIPSAGEVDLAGLITLELPPTVRRGQTFRVVVRQVMDSPAPQPRQQPAINTPAIAARAASVRTPKPSRHILGAFQFSIQVKTANEILPVDERTLHLIRGVAERIPTDNRWYPVFQRYISQLGARVIALGGDKRYPEPHPDPEHREEQRTGYEGKISGLLYDRFGDFEGFWLDTEDGRRHFHNREKQVEELVREAWERRIAVLVLVEKGEREEPQTIVLLRPPSGV